MIKQREPCNMGNRRFYNKKALLKYFYYEEGAYRLSTIDKLMPNIAIYCYATVKSKRGFINVHCINLVGFAFDSPTQPDYQYFKKKPLEELIKYYNKMWEYAFRCALIKKNEGQINKIQIYNVGGGAFAGPYGYDFIEKIFEPSFLPIKKLFDDNEIKIIGYDFNKKKFSGGSIPLIFDDEKEDYHHTLYVNAWDPWSLIGNGNSIDNSLDGAWGRCSNMSVLGWYETNKLMKMVEV
jgi:hypothetical protein